MPENPNSERLAVILHADIVGSTALVKQDEQVAHQRIQEIFHRFGETISGYHGRVRELRGDALLAEFERASDAVAAALVFQSQCVENIDQIDDGIRPELRVGIAMGEVIIADSTITGVGVVMAQRLEQLARAGEVVIHSTAYDTIPDRFPFDYEYMGEQEAKGFDDPVRAYKVSLKEGSTVPVRRQAQSSYRNPVIAAVVIALVIVIGLLLWWNASSQFDHETGVVEKTALPLPDRPSIVILPFDNLGDDPGQSYFADGLTEDLTTNLSLYRELFVIARNSAFVYKDRVVDAKQVGRELGVAYIVEGSVRREGKQIRINAQLIDAQTGRHVWGEKFDREFTDVFEIQDEITQAISGRIAPEINRAQVEESFAKPTEDLNAWDFYLQAVAAETRSNDAAFDQAIKLAGIAIGLDQNFSAPHVVIARAKGWQYFHRWTDNPEQTLNEAIENAQTAIQLDRKNAAAYAALGYLHRFSRNEIVSVSNLERAISLNPNDASIRLQFAHVLDWFRLQERALPQIIEAIRLSPRDPRLQMMFFSKLISYFISISTKHLLQHLER